MARIVNRLSAKKVASLKKRGWYLDGLGLYLQVSESGSKSWVYRFTSNGKQRWHGLGAFSETSNSLSHARENADECRQLLRKGVDPIQWKHQQINLRALEAAKEMTFDQCAEAFIKDREASKKKWTNKKHITQWRNTLTTYASPVIGKVSVQDIDVGMVLKIVKPIWAEKTETASRVRQRIEAIISWATVHGYRSGDNPARWRGHLDQVLEKPESANHHAALPYVDLPGFYEQLLLIKTPSSVVLRFIIQTATRSSEAREARKDEFDLENNVWEIPAERMKNRKPFRIPLNKEAIKVLKIAWPMGDELVFPGNSGRVGISEAAVRKLIKSKQPGVTIHGFRSTFRDWCAEQTTYPKEVAEMALSHSIGTKTEEAYLRTDLFAKRIKLMAQWARFTLSPRPVEGVVPFDRQKEKGM